MAVNLNQFGQPIGDDVAGWVGAEQPNQNAMTGQDCTLVALDDALHAKDLFEAFQSDDGGRYWTYMPVGPFATEAELKRFLEGASRSADPLFFTVIDNASLRAVGFCSFLRIDPTMGVIEVGFIAFSPLLQKTRMATEAMFLMMATVFDTWGYRRYEWKCDALNAPSKAAAKRFGFSFDGVFEQSVVYKGRNRDTAWFSILDKDWPEVKRAFSTWLEAGNFDQNGQQKRKLSDLMRQKK